MAKYGNLKANNLIYNLDDGAGDISVPLTSVAGKASLTSPDFVTDITLTAAAPVKFNQTDNAAAISLKAPGTGVTSYTITLPAVVGASGKVLKTSDGSGTLTWGDDTSLTLLDEDDFATDSATAAASQQSIKAYAAPKASPTFTGTVTAPIIDIDGAYKQTVTAITQSATPTVDLALGNYFTLTQNANVTSWTFSNAPASRSFSFVIELANVTYSTAWTLASGTVKWPADTAPTLAASKTHLIMFVTDDGGTTYRASSLADYTT